jgi:hypothetical protein
MGALLLIQFGAQGARVDPDAINNADWRGLAKDEALLTKTQVLLDRAFFSPGEIDGRDGDNDQTASTAFAQDTNHRIPANRTFCSWSRVA